MTELLRFALLGLGLGAIYGLVAQGIVLVFRGSGVLNFAHAAMAAVGAFVRVVAGDHGVPTVPAVALGVLAAAAVGVLTHVLVMRPLRRATALTRLVATLGVLTVLQAALVGWPFEFGDTQRFVTGFFPTSALEPIAGVAIGADRMWILGVGIGVSAVLWAVYRYTRFGLATSAVAEDQDAAAALGWSPDLVAAVNWGAGAGLAGLAGILVVPIIGLSVSQILLLLVPALAAALVGGFRSFPLTMLGGLLIGFMESELTSGADWIPALLKQPGWSKSVPFLVIIAVLVLRGRALPLRGSVTDRMPRLGTGRIRPALVLVVVGFMVVELNHLVAVFGYPGFDVNWIDSITTTLAVGTIGLSLVVVTGYTGQLSLAQYALAGVGAYVASRVAAGGELLSLFSLGKLPFGLALVLGVAGAIVVGLLVGLPALRTRGVNLAIVTLGLALLIERVVLQNAEFTGGFGGTVVDRPSLFGVDLDPITRPGRYATMCLLLFTLVALMVANLRRGRAGRRLVAVRANERAAASLGIGVMGAKLYAFGLSAGIAGLGGILLAFRGQTVLFAQFNATASIQVVVQTVLGGIGFVGGAIFGGAASVGGALSFFVKELFGVDDLVIVLATGVLLISSLIIYPDGVVAEVERWSRRILTAAHRLVHVAETPPAPLVTGVRIPPAPKALRIRHAHVAFGGVVALDEVSLDVAPGQVVGLIGPNGAGKTTLIDVMSGITRPQSGQVLLGEDDVSGWSPRRRARAGLARSFQSLELFEDMTVGDNLRAASDPHDRSAYLTDLVWSRNQRLSSSAMAAVREFGLEGDLEHHPDELSYGKRRLVAIARAVATSPSVLLLDEPAAGLDTHESAELGELIRRLAKDWGLAILLVEHDVALVMSTCDRIVALDFGRVIATGEPDEIRGDPSVVAAYLGQPAGVAALDREPVE